MKTYVLIVSRTYPKGHKKEEEHTYFVNKIMYTFYKFKGSEGLFFTAKSFEKCFPDYLYKLHTCRRNYEYWAKIIKEIQDGKAILSLRYWENPKGRSVKGNKQIEFAQLDKDSGIGVQKLEFSASGLIGMIKIDNTFPEIGSYSIYDLAKNDGLSIEDFKDWFKNYDLSEPLILIHFTNFRY